MSPKADPLAALDALLGTGPVSHPASPILVALALPVLALWAWCSWWRAFLRS